MMQGIENARRKSRQVNIGGIAIGGGAPMAVQTMLNAKASDVEANVRQARQMQHAGCEILRVSVPSMEDVRLVEAIKLAVDIPLVADIHFDHRIALACVEAGVDKIRLNPGNIGGQKNVQAVAELCRERGVPIRIGVNGGSLEKELLAKYGGPTADALVESAMSHVKMLEDESFEDIVISIKSSDVPTNVAAYRKLALLCDYPLHLGVTEAGTWRAGLVKNAVGIGSLLLDGIGDTLRVSLTAEPEKEIDAGFDILRAAGYPVNRPEIVSCPTCGRTNIPVEKIAEEVEARLAGSGVPLKVAVMGCVVNGLGEGKEADIGIAGGVDSAVLFVKGERMRTIHSADHEVYVQELLDEIGRMSLESIS
ncbi:flavodoxin-dependent (E)-4-hydroxy-3-methylbut-2-enyl-diphosphate synthase [Ruminococcaceae bacterium OttesenSCG-928-D13]|nr:flavodoxin-dependent (E)-4-hydroxy-3-methylbut-2-enyl-diphosphate synthase [Ruminococcaceae bacterium OttesenSCG-928-D13]